MASASLIPAWIFSAVMPGGSAGSEKSTVAGRIMLFAVSDCVKRCGAIAVLHLLQHPFQGANDRKTKNGSPVKNGGFWPIVTKCWLAVLCLP